MSPFPKKKLTAKDLQHPKDKRSAFNGDRIRERESQGFAERRASQGLPQAYESDNVSMKKEVRNGLYVDVDPATTETTGRAVKAPPRSLAVGGLQRGRHAVNNPPTHYSPGHQRPRGAPATAPLTLRKEGTDGSAK